MLVNCSYYFMEWQILMYNRTAELDTYLVLIITDNSIVTDNSFYYVLFQGRWKICSSAVTEKCQDILSPIHKFLIFQIQWNLGFSPSPSALAKPIRVRSLSSFVLKFLGLCTLRYSLRVTKTCWILKIQVVCMALPRSSYSAVLI